MSTAPGRRLNGGCEGAGICEPIELNSPCRPLVAAERSRLMFATSSLTLSSSASRIASRKWSWNSDAMRRAFAVMAPTARNAFGKSFGPIAINATAPMTIISLQAMSNM